MSDDLQHYYARRLAEERARCATAERPEARSAHEGLAELYEQRLRDIGKSDPVARDRLSIRVASAHLS